MIKKVLIILLLSICVCLKANAASIVYPKTNDVKINSPVTFFIGNENPKNKLKINNEEVKIHSSGGFYHVVNLNIGKNIFTIDNGNPSERKTYIITRPNVKYVSMPPKYTEYSEPKIMVTNADNVPLRATPSDDGHNRLQHFQKGIPLFVVGEQAKYYKIKLARDDYAWIDKSYLTATNTLDNTPAKIESYTYFEDSKNKIYSIKLSKKSPYILAESRAFSLVNNKYEPFSHGLDLVIYNIAGEPEDKYEFHIENDTNLYGYKAFYNDGNELVISVKKQPQISKSSPLKDIKITLDPGHGGSEYGAIGCLGDKEKDINLKIALLAKSELEKAGAKVYITRDLDKDLSLYDRVEFSQKNDSDIFISIHANALPDSAANSKRTGTSIYYFYPQANNLAQTLLDTMVKNLSMNNDGIRQESFAVIRNHESLSILVEVGYMIIPEDNAKLVDTDFQKKVADSIVRGLEKYYSEIQQ